MDILAIAIEYNANWGQKVLIASKHILEGLEAYDNAPVKGDPRGLFKDSAIDDYSNDIRVLSDAYDEICEAYHKISMELDRGCLITIKLPCSMNCTFNLFKPIQGPPRWEWWDDEAAPPVWYKGITDEAILCPRMGTPEEVSTLCEKLQKAIRQYSFKSLARLDEMSDIFDMIIVASQACNL